MATGGIALNGSTQYLELSSKVVSAFPFTLVCWVAQNSSGSSQFVIAQQQSNGDRYAGAWLDANGTTKYANLRNPGNSDSASKLSSPNPSAALQLMVAVFTSTTSRTVYFGDNTGATSTTSMTDDITSHDRITVGAWHYNSGAAGLFLNGTVAEAHIFDTALSSGDVTTLLTTPPEDVTGWVDGWTLSSNSDLTSIGGTRTLTAVGSPTSASLTLPYSRAAAPVLSSPTATATGPTQATIGVTSDTAPTATAISYQILPAASGAPSAGTIDGAPDGTISTGSAGALTKAITSLTTNTPVKVHFAQGATSNVVSTASFTPNTLASSGSPSAQTGTAGGGITWAGATPNSLLTNTGNGSGAWSIVSSAGFTVAPSINTSTGVLSGGTLSSAGAYAPQVRYTDSSTVPSAQTVTFTLSLTVSAAGGVTFSGTVPAQSGTVGTAFSLALTSYFTGTGTYAVQTGTLPPGLSLNGATGAITGTPTTAGTYSGVMVRKTAVSGSPATADTNAFTFTISAAPPPPPPPPPPPSGSLPIMLGVTLDGELVILS